MSNDDDDGDDDDPMTAMTTMMAAMLTEQNIRLERRETKFGRHVGNKEVRKTFKLLKRSSAKQETEAGKGSRDMFGKAKFDFSERRLEHVGNNSRPF